VCANLLQMVTACWGPLNGWMSEFVAGHVPFDLLALEGRKNAPKADAAEELTEVVWMYLK